MSSDMLACGKRKDNWFLPNPADTCQTVRNHLFEKQVQTVVPQMFTVSYNVLGVFEAETGVVYQKRKLLE